ncbi:MAG: S-formylglutathione hydrolase [Deltaproteobacteria bacterium]|nr:S-formylglutathione hydrolase [Deltaproteobacteria bacterium]
MEQTRSHKQFDGHNLYFTHYSEVCQSKMSFAAFVPPQAKTKKLPVLYYLSGLTCTPEIFLTEAQAQAHAKKHELILVVPDTSPRETGIEGENDSYDLGSGASFYVNATTPKWSRHYQMDTYVTQELRLLVEKELPVDGDRRGIFGHSMGGHGALVLGLRNPELYRSISAFAPICAPSKAPWGIKAFSEYLGAHKAAWAKYDAVELLKTAKARIPILVDQGTDDEFLASELFTDELERTVKQTGHPVTIRRQEGYDHSYFFISTFIADHLAFHAESLKSPR